MSVAPRIKYVGFAMMIESPLCALASEYYRTGLLYFGTYLVFVLGFLLLCVGFILDWLTDR